MSTETLYPQVLYMKQLFASENLTDDTLRKLEVYQSYLDDFIKSEVAEDMLFNATNLDASLLMYNLMLHTTESIKMVVGRFDGSVSEKGGYCDALQECLSENVSVDVIVLDELNTGSKAWRILRNGIDEGKRIRLMKGTEETKKILLDLFPQYSGNVHFALFDDDKYRLEINPDTYAAVASFNAPEAVKKLKEVFELLEVTSRNTK